MIIREVDVAGVSVAVTFEVRADRVPAGAVSVVGDFNGWDPLVDPLTRHSDGWCRATVTMPPGRYRFRYLAESDHWFDDETADAYESNRHGGYDGVLVLDLSGITEEPQLPDADGEIPAELTEPAEPTELTDEVKKPARRAKAKPAEEAVKPPRRVKEKSAEAPTKPAPKAKEKSEEKSAEKPSKSPRRAKDEPAEPKAKPTRRPKDRTTDQAG